VREDRLTRGAAVKEILLADRIGYPNLLERRLTVRAGRNLGYRNLVYGFVHFINW